MNDLGRGNNTPLHYASRNAHAEAVTFLLRNGANPAAVNWRGLTPAQVTEDEGVRNAMATAVM